VSEQDDIRVERVLQRLKEEVRQKRASAAAPSFKSGSVDLEQVHSTRRVNPHLPIAWPNWPPGLVAKMVALAKKVTRRLLRWYIEPLIEQQNEFNTAASDALEKVSAQLGRRSSRLERLETRTAGLRQDIQRHSASDSQLQRGAEEMSMRLGRLERRTRQSSKSADLPSPVLPGPPRTQIEHAPGQPELDYFRLEAKYRPTAFLKEKQKGYLQNFVGCQDVLDIGCGRGEFVQLLIEQGIAARGIDLDADAVAFAQESGLPVQCADALSYLASLPDCSLDGIFMAQVVEHLTPSYLGSLLRLCHEKMRPGAILIAETINPVCLWALANWYLIDPTHVRPVHPDTLSFILESAGFWRIEVEYLSPVPEGNKLSELADANLPAEVRAMARNINAAVRRLNSFLYGFQEYAVHARRPPDAVEGESGQGGEQEKA